MPVKYPVSILHSGIQDIHSQECIFLLLHTKAVQHNMISLQKERGSIGSNTHGSDPQGQSERTLLEEAQNTGG